jgi:AraC-like DNA-binding protein
VHEVFHARFADHAYPLHTHDAWTLLIVDAGAVTYDLDRREHGALRSTVSLLPPQVAHDGRSARTGGFRKRVVYLDAEIIGTKLIGHAVDQPDLVDPLLRRRVDRLHEALSRPGDEFEGESRLSMIIERLQLHLLRRSPTGQPAHRPLAVRLRDLLDEHLTDGVELQTAADELGASPTHLIRSFTRTFGLPPHRYLTGRRVERARRLLLDGWSISDTAQSAGFYDQAHLTRHLRRMIGATPASYQRSALRSSPGPAH